MKRILLIALALISGICSAQTFKIQNLDVLGTSTLTGLASFTVRPTFNGNTPWDSGNFNPSLYATLSNPIFSGAVSQSGVAGTFRSYQFETAGSLRWVMYADNSAESGSNAGSNFGVNAFSDSGSFLSTPLTISRASGVASFASRPVFAGNTPWDSGNLSISGFAYQVSNNAALQSLSTATTNTVTRLGFTSPGDAPPLLYTASASACSLNSGAGDNGSQVQSANAKCWIATFPNGPINVREFGATGNGSTIDTTAMQAAHNTGRVVYYPAGVYVFSTISMTAGGGVVGDGQSNTWLKSNDTSTANDVTFSSASLVGFPGAAIFSNFALIGPGPSKAGGAGLYITAPSSENQAAQLNNVLIYQFPYDLYFGAASSWSIQNCTFYAYANAGIYVQNTNNPDSGDSVIMGSTINGGTSTTNAGVLYASSGGLKIIGNKFLGGGYGVLLSLNAPSSTSDLLINGNSIEGDAAAGIYLSRSSGPATFSNIEIVGNQIAGDPNAIATDASGAFSNIVVNSNVITMPSTGGTAISFTKVSAFSIGGNNIFGNGGSPLGIAIDSTSSSGLIAPNMYINLATSISNSSGSTTVVTVP